MKIDQWARENLCSYYKIPLLWPWQYTEIKSKKTKASKSPFDFVINCCVTLHRYSEGVTDVSGSSITMVGDPKPVFTDFQRGLMATK